MKAAIIEKHGHITVGDMPEPQVGDYDALCELLYGATCTGTDSHIIAGAFPWISPLPTVLGHESVGRVVKLGRKVRNYRLGDLVTRVGTPPSADGKISVTWGGFAEFGIARDHWAMAADGLPAEQWCPHRWNQIVPAGVDPRIAPMFTTWRETLSYVNRLGVAAGKSLLVIGSGGNGLAFARHAVTLGATPVAMVGTASLETAARRLAGVVAYVDYRQTNWSDTLQKAYPAGFDFIIDAVGRTGVADRALPCLKDGGSYGTYGIDDFGKLTVNLGSARGAVTLMPCRYDEAETHQQVCELVLQGRLDVRLWYDPVNPYPLTEIGAAFAALRQCCSPKALVKLRG